MAEFLIKAISATNPDPVKNERGCYKRGDIVDVRPDGWKWGNEERLPKFVLVKIPGLDPKAALRFMEAHLDLTNPVEPILLRRRLWNVLVDDAGLPTQIKNALRTTGEVTVTLAQVRNYIRNKITGETA